MPSSFDRTTDAERAAAATITLAQVSDLHLGPLPAIPWRLLNAKRIVGALNWYRKRRAIHRPTVAAALRRDLLQQNVDHVAVTGDLANLGLPAEIVRGARWLADMGSPETVAVIPGNHDIYSTVNGQRLGVDGLAPWAPYFTSDAAGRHYGGGDRFPFVRVIRNGALRVALIGLNSAVETPPAIATGRLGGDQRAALERILTATGRDGLVRVVLIHHPPLPGLAKPRHELTDAPELAQLLTRAGAELILHGHNHRRMLSSLAGPRGAIPIVGAPSASAARARPGETPARSHLFQFRFGAGSASQASRPVTITLIARGLSVAAGGIEELERLVL